MQEREIKKFLEIKREVVRKPGNYYRLHVVLFPG
jgi:hypothetical protein